MKPDNSKVYLFSECYIFMELYAYHSYVEYEAIILNLLDFDKNCESSLIYCPVILESYLAF